MFSVSHSTIPVTTNGKTVTARPPRVGDRVRIERDETRYPPRGTWPRFRGRRGTVVATNLGELATEIRRACSNPPSRQ